jgi:hypothetical protein
MSKKGLYDSTHKNNSMGKAFCRGILSLPLAKIKMLIYNRKAINY